MQKQYSAVTLAWSNIKNFIFRPCISNLVSWRDWYMWKKYILSWWTTEHSFSPSDWPSCLLQVFSWRQWLLRSSYWDFNKCHSFYRQRVKRFTLMQGPTVEIELSVRNTPRVKGETATEVVLLFLYELLHETQFSSCSFFIMHLWDILLNCMTFLYLLVNW